MAAVMYILGGLHLLCLQYAAFKQIAPEQDIGFDLWGNTEPPWRCSSRNPGRTNTNSFSVTTPAC
jgi:hypothetical protein